MSERTPSRDGGPCVVRVRYSHLEVTVSSSSAASNLDIPKWNVRVLAESEAKLIPTGCSTFDTHALPKV